MDKAIKSEAPASSRKRKVGMVVSDKMDKTVVVEIVTFKTHTLYKKQYKSSKRYKAHDEANKHKVGDKVTIEECRPISRDKRWCVVEA